MKRALLVGCLVACDSETGTIRVELVTAPGSTILDGVQTLRMEVTDPEKVVSAERGSDGFTLGLDLPANGTAAAILVDAFDADGNLVANGATPRFSFGGVDGRVVIYMAAPDSVDVAPVALAVARSELAVGALNYGAMFVGGRAADGSPSTALDIYNAYDHTLAAGLALPAGRRGLALGVGSSSVYLFGGVDAGGGVTANLWEFIPGTPPSGAYIEIGDKPGFARAGESLVPIGNARFLLTGSPAGELHALDGSLAERDEVASLPPAGVTLTATDGRITSIFVGAAGAVRFRDNAFDTLSVPGRDAAQVVAVPGGKVAVVCGTTDALRIDAASGVADTFAGIPSVAKTGCAATATSRHLLIAGGTTGAGVDSTVEVYDATTFELRASATLAVPRTGAVAVALENDQILIAGGIDAAGAPVGTLELFTPLTR